VSRRGENGHGKPCPYGTSSWSKPGRAVARFTSSVPTNCQKQRHGARLLGLVLFDDGEVGGDLEVNYQLELMFYLEKPDGHYGRKSFLHGGVIFFAEGHAFFV